MRQSIFKYIVLNTYKINTQSKNISCFLMYVFFIDLVTSSSRKNYFFGYYSLLHTIAYLIFSTMKYILLANSYILATVMTAMIVFYIVNVFFILVLNNYDNIWVLWRYEIKYKTNYSNIVHWNILSCCFLIKTTLILIILY